MTRVDLTATIRLADEVSAKFDKIAQAGLQTTNRIERVGASAGTATDAVTRASQATENLGKKLIDTGSSANTATDVITKTTKATENLGKKLDAAEKETESFSEQLNETGKDSNNFSDTISKATDSLTSLLAAVGVYKALSFLKDAFKESIQAAITFESGITDVYKTIDGTSDQLDSITNQVKALSREMPASAAEISAVASAAGQLGIATEDVMSFSKTMLDLGNTTNLTSDEAASMLAQFANVTGLDPKNYERLGSTIVSLGNNLATTEADIVSMAQRIASAGTLAGLTETQILALAGSLSSVGIEADAGGSAMSSLISKMQVAVETGNFGKKSLADLSNIAGYTSEEFQALWASEDGAAKALMAFIAGLNDTERTGASATAILDELGLKEIRMSNAVRSLANNYDGLSEAMALADNAWRENTAMSKEAEMRYNTLQSKIQETKNAQTELSMTFGSLFMPIVEKANNVIKEITISVTDFTKKNPALVAGLSAGAVGFAGIATGGIAVAINLTKIKDGFLKVSTAVKALNTTFLASPWFWVAAGITAVTAAIIAIDAAVVTAKEEYNSWSGSTQRQYKELQNANTEYERTVKLYGENSVKAQQAKYSVDELTRSFDANKRTTEQVNKEIDEHTNRYNQMLSAYSTKIEDIDTNAFQVEKLTSRLEILGGKAVKSANDQREISFIVDELNKKIPGLTLSYDKLVDSFNKPINQVKNTANEAYEKAQYEVKYQRYLDLMAQQSDLEKASSDAYAEQQKALGAATAAMGSDFGSSFAQIIDMNKFNKATANANEASDALIESQKEVARLEKYLFTETVTSVEEVVKTMDTYEDAMNAYGIVSEEKLTATQQHLADLITAYQEAYSSARQSIDGQVGLFDNMDEKVKEFNESLKNTKPEDLPTFDNRIKDLNSQTEYLEKYKTNIDKARDLNLSEGLISQLSDGSVSSMKYLEDIVKQTPDKIKEINNAFVASEQSRDALAQSIVSPFQKAIDDELSVMETAINDLNMSDDAKTAAEATMAAYAEAIKAGMGGAVDAAELVSASVAAALAGNHYTPPVIEPENTEYSYVNPSSDSNTVLSKLPKMPVAPVSNNYFSLGNSEQLPYFDILNKAANNGGYANGTDSATEGVHLVGEYGPELVYFNGGERVVPTDETNDILSAYASDNLVNSKKSIDLNINLNGENIKVGAAANKESAAQVILENLRGAIINLLNEEVYNGGKIAYDY